MTKRTAYPTVLAEPTGSGVVVNMKQTVAQRGSVKIGSDVRLSHRLGSADPEVAV